MIEMIINRLNERLLWEEETACLFRLSLKTTREYFIFFFD